MHDGDIVPAVVRSADAAAIDARAGALRVTIDKKGFGWTSKAGNQLVKPGDLIEVRLDVVDADRADRIGTLEQPPLVEGAILAIDNRTGQVKAMVGGYSFERSKFNRATQALRQVGSSFKPIVYTAAIDRGFTPASLIVDAPVSFFAGPNQPPYSPQNYDHKFEGPVTLRHALEESRNVPAVRVMDQLGAKQVIAYARKMGLSSPLPPYLPVALGAAEATLSEMTSAFAVFPNQGVHMQTYSVLKVTDRDGNVLEENRPEPKDAIRADTAYVLTNLLRGVVQRGTAAKAASLNWPIGGKTGTTDDYTDAWFVGFDPDITIGVWVGLDQKKTIGRNMTGAEAALPDLDGRHEGLDRRPQGTAEVRAPGQHRVRVGRQRRQLNRCRHARCDLGGVHRGDPAGRDALTKAAGTRDLVPCSLSLRPPPSPAPASPTPSSSSTT